MKRTKELTTFVDGFAKKTFGRTLTESREQGFCVSCGKPVGGFRDQLSAKEYSISGLCQVCQDKVFGE